jgi:hypothetical protein
MSPFQPGAVDQIGRRRPKQKNQLRMASRSQKPKPGKSSLLAAMHSFF